MSRLMDWSGIQKFKIQKIGRGARFRICGRSTMENALDRMDVQLVHPTGSSIGSRTSKE
jgi:hypothetical protein